MRAIRQHQRQLAFEQLEPRAMLSASSLRIAPLAVHSHIARLAAAVGSAKVVTHGSPAAKVASAAVVKPAIATPLPGDLNFDGQVNAADIPELLLALTDPSAYEEKYNVGDATLSIVADVNQDGLVTNADLQRLLYILINQPPPPPPPPPPPAPTQVPITPTLQTFNTGPIVVSANNVVTASVPAASVAIVSGPAGIVVPGQLTEALLAGGGGDAQAVVPTLSNNGPPLPTHARTNDVALIAFASDAGGGADEMIQGMLMNLADVEEPQMLAIEYGDEVVKHVVTVNKTVVPAPVEQQPGASQTTAEQPTLGGAASIVPATVAPSDAPASRFFWQSYGWLIATAAGAAAGAAAWWTYRQRRLGNVGTLMRRLGL